MQGVLKSAYQRYFGDPQARVLAASLVLIWALIYFLGGILAPVFLAIVVAYLLIDFNDWLLYKGFPNWAAALSACLLIISLAIAGIFGMLPLLSSQIGSFSDELPKLARHMQELLMSLPERYPGLFNEAQVQTLIQDFHSHATNMGQVLIGKTADVLPGILTMVVYAVLVPLLVFFFLKDAPVLLGWFRQFSPHNSGLMKGVWHQVDAQIGNYIRGKLYEIMIVGGITYIAFLIVDIRYTLLLSVFIGLSVLIPYVGATLMTVPVAFVAYTQWGFTGDFWTATIVYLAIQTLDGNLLVPLLFSEAVNLHPVAIIVAVLFFGGIWGFWGIFFAIPLATVVHAVMELWPTIEPDGVSSNTTAET